MKRIIIPTAILLSLFTFCACGTLQLNFGLYNCFLPSDDFSAFNGENYYYISEGILYEDGEMIYDDKSLSQIFVNSSYVFASSDEEILVIDFDGNEKYTYEIPMVYEICGDDEYVFFSYEKDGTIGTFCDFFAVASGEMSGVNELINEQCRAGNYCEITQSNYASYVDVGAHRIFATVTNANIESSDYPQQIYLCNQNQSGFFDVDENGTMYFENYAISESYDISKVEFKASVSNGALIYAGYPDDNIVIAEQNDGYNEPTFEPWESYHISSTILKLNEENKIYEKLFETSEDAQIVGFYNSKAIVLDYDDLKVYTDDMNGNKSDIYTFDSSDIDEYIYFETTGDKLFVFTAKDYSHNGSDVEFLYSCQLY